MCSIKRMRNVFAWKSRMRSTCILQLKRITFLFSLRIYEQNWIHNTHFCKLQLHCGKKIPFIGACIVAKCAYRAWLSVLYLYLYLYSSFMWTGNMWIKGFCVENIRVSIDFLRTGEIINKTDNIQQRSIQKLAELKTLHKYKRRPYSSSAIIEARKWNWMRQHSICMKFWIFKADPIHTGVQKCPIWKEPKCTIESS